MSFPNTSMSAYCGCITIFPSLSTIPYFPSFFVLNEFSIPDIAVISSYSVGIISFPEKSINPYFPSFFAFMTFLSYVRFFEGVAL